MQIPADDDAAHLAQQYAELLGGFDAGADKPLLVLPNSEFFPDSFRGDEASLNALVARMQGYAALEEIDVQVRLIGDVQHAPSAGGCGSGACGVGPAPSESGPRVVQAGDQYLLQVPALELRHSIVLTSRLAASLGAIYLFERHSEGENLAQDAAVSEMAALELGFGVLLLEASYLYAKSCGGPSIQRATALSVGELALLFALFLARHDYRPRQALGELGTTQKALVKQAWALVDQSPDLVRGLKSDLPRIARGRFKLRQGRSLLSRLFGGGQKRPVDRETEALAALERGASVDELADLLGVSPGRKP